MYMYSDVCTSQELYMYMYSDVCTSQELYMYMYSDVKKCTVASKLVLRHLLCFHYAPFPLIPFVTEEIIK